jgi:hypothetical protein
MSYIYKIEYETVNSETSFYECKTKQYFYNRKNAFESITSLYTQESMKNETCRKCCNHSFRDEGLLASFNYKREDGCFVTVSLIAEATMDDVIEQKRKQRELMQDIYDILECHTDYVKQDKLINDRKLSFDIVNGELNICDENCRRVATLKLEMA